MRGRLVHRLAYLLRLLAEAHVMPNLQTLAADLGVSRRTVYRDLQALQAAGWPLPRRWME